MLRKPKKNIVVQVGTKPLVLVDPTLPSFEGHPFFEKKANAVKTLLTKVGLPKGMKKKLS
jgi:hypothetical protein